MKKSYYLFNPGRVERKDNTICIKTKGENENDVISRYIPITDIESIYVFGSIDANSALFNFLGQNQISVHFFDYYEHYTGSFQPKEYLLAGKVQIEQTKVYLEPSRRLHIAKGFVEGATANMIRNLKYYSGRGKNLEDFINSIEKYKKNIYNVKNIEELMGLEGNCKQAYYDSFDHIVSGFEMGGRIKQPPANEINAMISFGNMLCYARTLDAIYHTQLNPTISFLHEPGARRYSLALDIAEIFKPIIVDRIIFSLVNKKEVQSKHFETNLNGCTINKTGKQIFLKAFDEKLKDTIHHRVLNKKVSYKYLIQLECYKIIKYIIGTETSYKPFKMWW